MTSTVDSPIAIVRSIFASLNGVSILDVGCGEGALARMLVAEGARVTGIDPNPDAISKARETTPAAIFEQAEAQSLPFGGGAFDAVVLMNTLHHVPLDAMDAALREAARVVRSNGSIVVIEPLAEGSFFDALRRVEDETMVRRAAQEAIARAVAAGVLRLKSTVSYVRRETFADAGQFLNRIVAVDPARHSIVQANREAVIAAALAAAMRTEDGKLAYDQPIKADILSPRPGS